MKGRMLIVGMVVLAVFAGWSDAIAAEGKGKGEIKIGYSSSLVAGNRPQTLDVVNGGKIAIQEINSAGGVLGRKLDLIFLDNQGQVDKAVAQVKELCVKHNIDFAISCDASDQVMATSATYQRYKMPAVISSSMADEVMEAGNPYYMRVCNPNSLCAIGMVRTIKHGDFKRPSIMYVNNLLGTSLRKYMLKEMESLNLKAVSEANFELASPDVSPQIMKMLSANPDIMLVVAYGADLSLIVRTARAQGYKGTFVAFSAAGMNATRESAGHELDGMVFGAGWHGQGFYLWHRPGIIPYVLNLESKYPIEKYKLVHAPFEPSVYVGYQLINYYKKWIELAGERCLKDKDYFMDVVAKSNIRSVLCDVKFPYGRKNMTAVTIDDIYMRQYVNGHIRLWPYEPKCIETFETTRCQAEEEIYSGSEKPVQGVTYKKFLARWQQLLRQNQGKIESEVNNKLNKGAITREYGEMFKKAFSEMLAYKF